MAKMPARSSMERTQRRVPSVEQFAGPAAQDRTFGRSPTVKERSACSRNRHQLEVPRQKPDAGGAAGMGNNVVQRVPVTVR
jgi:hypothetical protein